MADADEEPSLIQADLAETVHREHPEHADQNGDKHTHGHFQHRQRHLHLQLHNRQGAPPASSGIKVREVVQTVSVVQQVAVDGNGQTLSVSATTVTATTGGDVPTNTATAILQPALPVPWPTTIPIVVDPLSTPTPTPLPGTDTLPDPAAPSSPSGVPPSSSLVAVNGTGTRSNLVLRFPPS